MALSDNATNLASKGTTGTGRFSASGFAGAQHVLVELQVEAVGATPTLTYTIQGSNDGVNWVDLEYLDQDSAVAAVKTGLTVTATGKTFKFVDGLDKRFFDIIAVNVSANTNVTFSARAYKRGAISVS